MERQQLQLEPVIVEPHCWWELSASRGVMREISVAPPEGEREGTKSWGPCRAACLQQISVLLDWAA